MTQIGAALAMLASAVVAGCTPGSSGQADATPTDTLVVTQEVPGAVDLPPVDPAVAEGRFIACLRQEGIQARSTGSSVEVLFDAVSVPPDQAANINSDVFRSLGDYEYITHVSTGGDDSGVIGNIVMWVTPVDERAFIGGDPRNDEFHDAWVTCQSQHPDFSQPGRRDAAAEMDAEWQGIVEHRMARALPFAQCAREHGFAWVADPLPGEPEDGSISIPRHVTGEEFQQLLEQCFDPEIDPEFVGEIGPTWRPADGELSFDLGEVLDRVIPNLLGWS